MQSIMQNEQDREQTDYTMTVGSHVGNLFLGLFVGLLVMFFDRRRNLEQLPQPPHNAAGSWLRSSLIFGGVLLLIVLFIVLLMGP